MVSARTDAFACLAVRCERCRTCRSETALAPLEVRPATEPNRAKRRGRCRRHGTLAAPIGRFQWAGKPKVSCNSATLPGTLKRTYRDARDCNSQCTPSACASACLRLTRCPYDECTCAQANTLLSAPIGLLACARLFVYNFEAAAGQLRALGSNCADRSSDAAARSSAASRAHNWLSHVLLTCAAHICDSSARRASTSLAFSNEAGACKSRAHAPEQVRT